MPFHQLDDGGVLLRDHARRTGDARFSSDAAAASAATPSSWRAPRSSWAAGLASVAGSAGSAIALVGSKDAMGRNFFCCAVQRLAEAAPRGGCVDGLVRGPWQLYCALWLVKSFLDSGPGRVSPFGFGS